jgi:hypothetical protein
MNRSTLLSRALVLAAVTVATFAPACASNDGAPIPAAADVNADQVEIVRGVPDQGRNPAVVAIDIGEIGLCTGALIAPRVVLTARHCVSKTSEQVACPAEARQILGDRAPSSLTILVGDDVATAVRAAQGADVVAPAGDTLCGADIALIVLDRPIRGIAPLNVHQEGVAKGAHVSAVGFGRRGDGDAAGTKLLRQHVRVLDTSDSEFLVGEATCQGDSGGPALDEGSGEIVGVVSRGGPACDGSDAHNIYTRTDVFHHLIDEAFSRVALIPTYDADDAGAGHPKKDAGSAHAPSAKKPKSDMGSACQSGNDCAAGVCVNEHGKQYCSRTCDSHDRCPAHFHCATLNGGKQVCTEH